MRASLTRVLDHLLDGAMVVSTIDDAIVYVNPAARALFGWVHEDMSMVAMMRELSRREGYITSMEASGYGTLKSDPMMPMTVTHTPLRGGMWSVGSRLPDVTGFPPCVIFTSTLGGEDARALAYAQHVQIALGARMALELDVARGDLETAQQMLAQASYRVERLSRALETTAMAAPEAVELGTLSSLG